MELNNGDVRLFLVPAVNPEEREALELSVSSRVKADLSTYLTADQYDAAAASDGNLYAWSFSNGEAEQQTWEAVRKGDYIVLHDSQAYLYIAAATYRCRNAELASAIWGESGMAKDLIVFLDTPSLPNSSLERLSEFLQPVNAPTQLSEATLENIRSSYTTVRDFVLDRFYSLQSAPSNYLILRMNQNSDWNDKENAYHYGRIANYTKVKVGSAVILDRKSSHGVEILGHARVTNIVEMEDRSFEASLSRTDTIARPYTEDELNTLKIQPGYNVQHSIRPINSELYRSLAGTSPLSGNAKPTSRLTESIDQRLLQIQEVIGWPIERVRQTYETLRESRALLVAGPPGTGKTFLAQAFRENLTDAQSDSEIVVFHPNYSYEDFIQGIRPKLAGSQLGYELHNGIFYRIRTRDAVSRSAVYHRHR